MMFLTVWAVFMVSGDHHDCHNAGRLYGRVGAYAAHSYTDIGWQSEIAASLTPSPIYATTSGSFSRSKRWDESYLGFRSHVGMKILDAQFSRDGRGGMLIVPGETICHSLTP